MPDENTARHAVNRVEAWRWLDRVEADDQAIVTLTADGLEQEDPRTPPQASARRDLTSEAYHRRHQRGKLLIVARSPDGVARARRD